MGSESTFNASMGHNMADDAMGRERRLAEAKAAAREEAKARRLIKSKQDRPTEINGRGGEEPTRYGDWEVKGLASDF